MTDPSEPQTLDTRIEAFAFGLAGAVPLPWRTALTAPVTGPGFLWFDVTDPTPQGLEDLRHQFQLHPLAIEDAVHAHQRAKVETYPGFEFVVANGVTRTPAGDLNIHELNLFASETFLISVRHGAGLPISDVIHRWEQVPATWRTDSSSLLYVLLDALVDEFSPFADQLEGELRDLRRQLIRPTAPGEHDRSTIFELTELVHAAHAVVFPLNDVLSTLMRVGLPVVSREEVPYFRDIRDHAVRMAERLDLARTRPTGRSTSSTRWKPGGATRAAVS